MIPRVPLTRTFTRRPNSRLLAGVVVSGAALAMMVFGGVGVALAQDCPITDPTCVIDTVGNTIGDVQKTVDDTTKKVKDDVAATTDTVNKTVDGLIGDGGQPPGGGNPGGASGHDGKGSKNGGSGGALRHGGAPTGPSVLTRGSGTPTLLGTATTATSNEASSDPSRVAPSIATRLRAAALEIALSLLMVLGAVVLFATIQGRLDRREPKLALAPVTADVVTFT
jgi:hypothetical protein